jgi:hypothetical protein
LGDGLGERKFTRGRCSHVKIEIKQDRVTPVAIVKGS